MLKSTLRLSLLLLIGFPSLPQFEVRTVSGVVVDKSGEYSTWRSRATGEPEQLVDNVLHHRERWMLLLQQSPRRCGLYVESRVPELLLSAKDAEQI